MEKGWNEEKSPKKLEKETSYSQQSLGFGMRTY